jgi:hypothetical protein
LDTTHKGNKTDAYGKLLAATKIEKSAGGAGVAKKLKEIQ